MIKRTFSVRDNGIILQLFKSLVCQHLEYKVQARRPNFQKDIYLLELEGVQRRDTALENITYEDRLDG